MIIYIFMSLTLFVIVSGSPFQSQNQTFQIGSLEVHGEDKCSVQRFRPQSNRPYVGQCSRITTLVENTPFDLVPEYPLVAEYCPTVAYTIEWFDLFGPSGTIRSPCYGNQSSAYFPFTAWYTIRSNEESKITLEVVELADITSSHTFMICSSGDDESCTAATIGAKIVSQNNYMEIRMISFGPVYYLLRYSM